MRPLPDGPCTLHVLIDPAPGRHRGAAGAPVGASTGALLEALTSTTPAVEVVGEDQAFLDVAGARRLLGPPPRVAEVLRRRVRERTGAGCAVGVAPTRTVARLASACAAPDGVVVVTADAAPAFMAPLPVHALPGVDPATAARLARLGVRRVVDLHALDRRTLVRVLGRALAERLVTVAAGDDPPSGRGGTGRPVGAVPGPWGAAGPGGEGVGGEHAFDRDVVDEDAVLRAVLALCVRAAALLRADARAGRTVALTVRLADRTILTRSTVLDEPTDLTAPLRAGASAAWARRGRAWGCSVPGCARWGCGWARWSRPPRPTTSRSWASARSAGPRASGRWTRPWRASVPARCTPPACWA